MISFTDIFFDPIFSSYGEITLLDVEGKKTLGIYDPINTPPSQMWINLSAYETKNNKEQTEEKWEGIR